MEGLFSKDRFFAIAMAIVFGTVAVFVLSDVILANGEQVVINEVMWMGASVGSSDEWIELRNFSGEDVDISDWVIEGAGSGDNHLEIPSDSVIGGNGYFLISDHEVGASALSDSLFVDFAGASLSFLNGGEELVLKNSDGEVVDTVGASDGWMAGENGEFKKSMERDDGGWHSCEVESCTNLDYWDSVGVDYGTPGAVNSSVVVNTGPTAVISGPNSALVGEAITFSGEDSSDGDEDELSFAWDLGDETESSDMEVTHSYSEVGTFVVVLTVSDGDLSDVVEQEMVVSAQSYSDDVVINEFLSNPKGSDTENEFIEIKNMGSDSVDLGGWQLDDSDGGSAPYTIGYGVVIGGGGILAFNRSDTKIALNNSADTVRILNPNGDVVSSYSYDSSIQEGISVNRNDNGDYEESTTVTKGSSNIISKPNSDEEEDDEDLSDDGNESSSSVAGSSVKKVALKDIREEEAGEQVEVEGVVSVPPNIFNEKIMYLSGSGVQVYFSKSDWPDVKLGDKLKIVGVISSNQGETRIKVASKGDVVVKGKVDVPVPHQVATGEINDELEGSLVIVQGHVAQTSGNTFYVDDGSGEIKIYIDPDTDIIKPKMKKGMAVTISGVVSETRSGYRILPRWQEDVRLGLVAGISTLPATGLPVEKVVVFLSLLLAGYMLRSGHVNKEDLLMPLYK